jgi:hypothetical protein
MKKLLLFSALGAVLVAGTPKALAYTITARNFTQQNVVFKVNIRGANDITKELSPAAGAGSYAAGQYSAAAEGNFSTLVINTGPRCTRQFEGRASSGSAVEKVPVLQSCKNWEVDVKYEDPVNKKGLKLEKR